MREEVRPTRSSPGVLLAIGAFFAALWAPLGHRAFLELHWMKIGAPLALLTMWLGLSSRRQPGAARRGLPRWDHDERLLACLLTAAYLVHQIEEHWVDLLGRRYPLYEILNELLAGAFGAAADGAMTPAAIFFVNTTLVWLTGFLSIWRGGGFAVDALAGVVTVNGIAHIVQALATGTYNPGLATALSLFAPLAFAAARGRRAASATTARRLGLGALWGLAAHALLVAGVVASNVHGVVPTTAFYAVLATWGALPALIGQYASERDPAPLSQVE